MDLFLHSPISVTLIGTEWPRLNFRSIIDVGNDWNVTGSGFGGEIPNAVNTVWMYTNLDQRRHRFEWVLSSLNGWCSVAVDGGSWGSRTRNEELFWEGHIPKDWGFQIPNVEAIHSLTVDGYCASYSLTPGALPQTIHHVVTHPVGYRCFRHDQQRIVAAWVDIGGLQEVDPYTFQLAMDITFNVVATPVPVANPRIVLTSISIAPTERVAPDQKVGFTFVLEKRAADNAWETAPLYLACVCNGKVRTIWSGTMAAGPPETTRKEISFELTPEEMMQESLGATQPIVPYFYAGNGMGYDPSTATDSKSWGITVWVETPEKYGTILVTSTPSGAAFNLTGPVSYSGTAPKTYSTAPIGEYRITWAPIAGFRTPVSPKKVLTDRQIISFDGTYVLGPDDDEDKSYLLPIAAGAGILLLGVLVARRRRK